MENLKLSTSFADPNKEIVIVDVQGYVDQANCSQLEFLFKELKEDKCYKLIFDFKNLIYLSSAGWGIFVGEIKEFKEHGGDIKIINMNPQVYEVYQMLEFYHILNDYPSLEDALKAFNMNSGLSNYKDKLINEKETLTFDRINDSDDYLEEEITDSVELNMDIDKDHGTPVGDTITPSSSIVNSSQETGQLSPLDLEIDEKMIDVAKLPIHEKIKKLVAQYPLISIFQIKKMLSHEEFGREKINLFRLYNLLKKLNLETKDKRYRYWRSC